jgi:hypothetical protein
VPNVDAGSSADRRRPARTAAAILSAALLLFIVPLLPVPFGAAVALADDDDDGGGGPAGGGASSRGDGGGWFDSSRRFKKARPKHRSQWRRRAARPEIVAIDLPASSLPALERRGYRVLERDALAAIGTTIFRLRLPRRVSVATARQTLIAAGARMADANTLYYRPQMARCRGRACRDWPARDATAPVCRGTPTIGIVDTRVATDHPALLGQAIEVITLRRQAQRASRADHGTAIAALLVGAIASDTPGIIPGARLIAADPYHRAGGGDRADAYAIARAIDVLVARRPAVINLSLAGPANDVLKLAVTAGIDGGIPIVAAAGNNGPSAPPLYPAGYEQVTAVTAVDPDGKPYRRAARGAHIDFAAPGVGIAVAAPRGKTRVSGTSFAAPFVAAAYAADRDPAQLAGDLGEPGRDAVFGFGLLDPAKICGP